LILAIAASPPDAPKPTKLDQFVAAHPTVATASATAATPASFADEEYHGINAFIFVNKAGERQAVPIWLNSTEAGSAPTIVLLPALSSISTRWINRRDIDQRRPAYGARAFAGRAGDWTTMKSDGKNRSK
jgi:hypothetical protein